MSHKKWQDDNGGYSRIANKLLESWAKLPLNGREARILLAIIRRTYGYGKKQAPISGSLLSKMTGISRANCTNVLTSLKAKGVLLNSIQGGAIESDTGGCIKSNSGKTGKFAPQVIGVNKHIAKCVNFDTVLLNSIHIKDIINIFREERQKGNLGDSLLAFEKKNEEIGIMLDKYCVKLIDCLKHITSPGPFDSAVIDPIIDRINLLYSRFADKGEDTFNEFRVTLNELYQSAQAGKE
jgi:phage replication O-like protein O